MTILIVDDEQDVEPLFRQKFRKEMKAGDVELTFAFSGAAALEAFKTEAPVGFDFILVDLNMPDLNGLDVLRQIKQISPAQQVYIVTGYGDSENQKRAVEARCDGFLTKPVDFEDIKKKFGLS